MAPAAEADVSPAQLASELLTLWHFLMKGSSKELYGLLAELDLSMTDIKALHTLDDQSDVEGCSVKQLSEQLGLSLPGCSRAVETLLQRGYLKRHEDEHDRRVKRVRLTEEGHSVVHRIEVARLAGLEEFTSAMTAEQRAHLSAALHGLPHISVTR
ncbi:MAG: MarR family transcriptional regulator [Solirubrobacterales bacterium]|jgi:DNA-binding MarR family transcriptional regulator|nr:MarR family transcriptional regulator [Solirubrobacterales bacterium]